MRKEPGRGPLDYRKLALGAFATVVVVVAGWLGFRPLWQGDARSFGEFLEAL